MNARRKRRLVSGMREVEKAVRGWKAKVLIVAPNVAALVGAVEGGEGGPAAAEGPAAAPSEFPIEPLLASARESGVPVVFALSRQRLGKLMGQRKRASAFAVLDASGADAQLREVLALAEAARAEGREDE